MKGLICNYWVHLLILLGMASTNIFGVNIEILNATKEPVFVSLFSPDEFMAKSHGGALLAPKGSTKLDVSSVKGTVMVLLQRQEKPMHLEKSSVEAFEDASLIFYALNEPATVKKNKLRIVPVKGTLVLEPQTVLGTKMSDNIRSDAITLVTGSKRAHLVALYKKGNTSTLAVKAVAEKVADKSVAEKKVEDKKKDGLGTRLLKKVKTAFTSSKQDGDKKGTSSGAKNISSTYYSGMGYGGGYGMGYGLGYGSGFGGYGMGYPSGLGGYGMGYGLGNMYGQQSQDASLAQPAAQQAQDTSGVAQSQAAGTPSSQGASKESVLSLSADMHIATAFWGDDYGKACPKGDKNSDLQMAVDDTAISSKAAAGAQKFIINNYSTVASLVLYQTADGCDAHTLTLHSDPGTPITPNNSVNGVGQTVDAYDFWKQMGSVVKADKSVTGASPVVRHWSYKLATQAHLSAPDLVTPPADVTVIDLVQNPTGTIAGVPYTVTVADTTWTITLGTIPS